MRFKKGHLYTVEFEDHWASMKCDLNDADSLSPVHGHLHGRYEKKHGNYVIFTSERFENTRYSNVHGILARDIKNARDHGKTRK